MHLDRDTSLRPGSPARGPEHRRRWRADLAYAIGLLVTDGHLSVDRRHITLVSVDVELLETFRNILALPNRICRHPTGRLGIPAYRVQFGDRLFYDWLTAIGFTPRKTYTIGQLKIPDKLFRDFLRGHLDGDGSIIAYVDRYNTSLKTKYVYQRLYVRFLTASKPHIEWLQAKVTELLGVDGYLVVRPGDHRKVPMYSLHFAKKDAIKLLRWIYYAPDLPCLARNAPSPSRSSPANCVSSGTRRDSMFASAGPDTRQRAEPQMQQDRHPGGSDDPARARGAGGAAPVLPTAYARSALSPATARPATLPPP